jgi:hypothetical protein
MTRFRERFAFTLPAVLVALSVVACGGSDGDGPTDPDPVPTQGATAVATPNGAVISRGGATTSVTVVFTAIGGVTINSITINKQYPGITVTQTSTQTSGNVITRVFAIGADNTVPLGTHEIRFTPAISGATVTPQVTIGRFNLTVTQ